jgi:ornithine cyclodeaminase
MHYVEPGEEGGSLSFGKRRRWTVTTTPADFLYLSQEDVIQCDVLNMRKALARIELALAIFDRGECVDPPKSVLRWGEDPNLENTRGRVNFLSAYLGGEIDALGMKWIAGFPMNRETGDLPRATALIVLNDPRTGVPIAVMEGALISAIRTGAITGIAAKYLARRDTSSIGIIGTGVQSRTQLMALCSVLPEVDVVKVFNRTRENAVKFVNEMEERVQKRITIVDDAESAVRGSDLAVVATTAHEPLLRGEWLSPGMMTVQFSGDECDYDVIRRADKIVCDDWETVKHRGITTPAVMHREGLFDDEQVHADLGEIVNRKKTGRENDRELIHFAAIGMGISDVALASMIFETAIDRQIGTRLALWQTPIWT